MFVITENIMKRPVHTHTHTHKHTHLTVSTAGMNRLKINIPLQITSQDGHPTTWNQHKPQFDAFHFSLFIPVFVKVLHHLTNYSNFNGNKSGAASTHHGGLHRPRLFETREVISCAVIFPLLALVAETPSRGQHSRFNSVSGSEG